MRRSRVVVPNCWRGWKKRCWKCCGVIARFEDDEEWYYYLNHKSPWIRPTRRTRSSTTTWRPPTPSSSRSSSSSPDSTPRRPSKMPSPTSPTYLPSYPACFKIGTRRGTLRPHIPPGSYRCPRTQGQTSGKPPHQLLIWDPEGVHPNRGLPVLLPRSDPGNSQWGQREVRLILFPPLDGYKTIGAQSNCHVIGPLPFRHQRYGRSWLDRTWKKIEGA